MTSATFVGRIHQHPLYPDLSLVIWRLGDGTWSHDALHPDQEVGDAEPASGETLRANLRTALLGRAGS